MSVETLNPISKKGVNRRVIALFLVALLILGYAAIQYVGYRTQQRVLAILEPVQQACQSAAGCPLVPTGWREVPCAGVQFATDLISCASPPKESSFRAMLYQANSQRFIMRWQYLSDAEITVAGGRGRAMDLQERALP